ncbi:MAG: hypothetical protein ACI9SC_001520, partial [Gammaproteobacteria bacterium]
AAEVIIGTLVLVSLLAWLLSIQPLLSLVMLLTIWVPVCLCAAALRRTQKPVMMSLTAAGLAVAYIFFMYVRFGDVESFWRSLLQEMLNSELAAGNTEQIQQAIEIAPPLMNAVVASSLVISLTAAVLIARWWQSSLFNPGGFSKEFHVFCLPKQLALPTIVGMGLLFLGEQAFAPLLRELLVVMVILYLFQGIASIHRTVKKRSLSSIWLIVMYFLLASWVLTPVMVIFIAWIGMTDSLLSSRTQSNGDGE